MAELPSKSLSILLSFPGLLSALISFFLSHCNQKRVTLVCSWALMLWLILYGRTLLRNHHVAQLLVLKHKPLKVLMHHLHDIFVLRGALNGNLLLIGLNQHKVLLSVITSHVSVASNQPRVSLKHLQVVFVVVAQERLPCHASRLLPQSKSNLSRLEYNWPV